MLGLLCRGIPATTTFVGLIELEDWGQVEGRIDWRIILVAVLEQLRLLLQQ